MADFNSKYSGEQVEALLDQVAGGNAGGGGGGGITVETDPIFSASPAASITEDDKATWSGKQDAISDLANIRSGANKGATAVQPEDLKEEVYIADFTMESLRNGLRNGAQVQCDMQALVVAMNANKVILVRESEDSGYKGVHVLNGYAEDLLYFSIVDTSGSILWCDGTALTDAYIDGRTLHLQSWDDKQDALKSGENIKTINGESILGEGNIEISGGSGEVGPQGPQGDKGDTGVGVSSVKQTTISNTDGGSNVVTVTLTNGATSTFTVKNGSKGSTGADGATFTPSVDSAGNLSWTNNKGLANPPTVNIKGPKGDKGDVGEGGGGSGGGPTVEFLDYQGLINIEDNKVYQVLFPVTELTIDIVSELYTGSVLRFITEFEGCTFTMPDNVYWANGIIPNIKGSTYYELSLTSIDMLTILAVLTPFEQV